MPKFFDPVNYGKQSCHDVTIYGSVLTLTGSSGTANITINGYLNTTIATYAGASLTTTAANWVAANYAYYYARGFIITNVAQVITVNPRYGYDSVNRINVSIANATTNLSGTLTGRCQIDFSKGRNWRITAGQAFTILAPKNAKDGERIRLEIKTTGNYAVTWTAAAWYFAGGTEPTQTSTSTDIYEGVFQKKFAQRYDTLTLSGSTTNGHSASITMAGITATATVAGGSLTTTATNFVTANEDAFAAVGITLTSSGADLIFTVATSGSDAEYYAVPVIVNVTGTLNGTNVQTPKGRVLIDTKAQDIKQ